MIAEAVDLPGELLPGMPLVEISGDSRVMIENHNGIAAYSEDCICMKVSFGFVSVRGRRMQITKLKKNQIVIAGKIEQVELKKESKH